jgi:hypothetical protein
MRLSDIKESMSLNSSSKDLIDGMVTRFADMHSRIRKILKDSYDRNGGEISDKAIKLIVGGQKSRMKVDEYDNVLKPALYSLLQKTNDQPLKKFLSDAVNEQYNLSGIEARLPDILLDIAKKTNNKKLETGIHVWKKEIRNTVEFINSLLDNSSTEDDYVEPKEKDNIIGQQNSTVDVIINDVLKRINPKHAGEIRNTIAKQDNKLMALERELTKRGIKLSEEYILEVNTKLILEGNNMRLYEFEQLDEGPRQDKAIELFNKYLPKRTEANDRVFRQVVIDQLMADLGIHLTGAAGLYNYARLKANLPDLGRTAERTAKGLAPVVRGASKPKQLDMFGKSPDAKDLDTQGNLF